MLIFCRDGDHALSNEPKMNGVGP